MGYIGPIAVMCHHKSGNMFEKLNACLALPGYRRL